jgi:hypothetical protein
MYFDDLSPYEYDRRPSNPAILNVGWLSRDHAFETGDVPPEFVQAIRRMVASPVNLYRGVHICEFCSPPPVTIRNGLKWIDPPPETAGNGEIRVVDSDGQTYVAPVLVLHYIQEHRYQPPEAFISAVLRQR